MSAAEARFAERLAAGPVLVGEGYLFELERRGYLQAGGFVPEVVLEHPEALAQFHREYVRAGSDVVEAFTYYAHREKLRLMGKEGLLERLNREAISLARRVADEFEDEAPLVAGNICNTNVYHPDDVDSARRVRAMFEEQVGWAADEGVDLVIAETFYICDEARLALEVVRDAGLPAVVTLALPATGQLMDGYDAAGACRILADEGADVVGLNCFRGPATMLPELRRIRGATDAPIAALPVPYRTDDEHPTFFSFRDTSGHLPQPGPFPTALEPFLADRYELADFVREAVDLGVSYIGLCCGGAPNYLREMAEALGREPQASEYSPDMSKHFAFGTDPSIDPMAVERSSEL
jgi:betaine-homocysteine S-methyltransferase